MVRQSVHLLRKYKPGRIPQPESSIPYKEAFTLQLLNEVSNKGKKGADVSCIQEMAVMFACLKKNDFKEAKCSPEMGSFMSCYKNYEADKKLRQAKEESGTVPVTRNPRDLTSKQLNMLLEKYPHQKEKRLKPN